MVNAQPIAAESMVPVPGIEAEAASVPPLEESLVPVLREPPAGLPNAMAGVMQLPVELEVSVPIRAFRVRNLLALEPGQVIETQWEHTGDLPLSAGEVQLAWSEFEVVNHHLAVRLTRLA